MLLMVAGVSNAATAALPDEPIQPVPLTLHQNPARAEIGRRLFHDARLSGTGRLSCASCHDLGKGGDDGRARSTGQYGALGQVNTPTVFNAALNFRQLWNGGAASLETQIDHIIQNPAGMGSSWPEVAGKVANDAEYRRAFALAYGDGITPANIRNALATFERTLITPNARFDQFLRGNASAITAAEKAGYAKFKQYGCVACHQGVNVGGNMYQKFGVMGNYFEERGHTAQADLGRYLITRVETDRHVFKVPSLRNVALTAPYFHDASASTLEEAVDVMFRYQLGRAASRQDKDAIVRFLGTLTGTPEARP
jgi:cytochrome c peroxidase